MWPTRLRQTVHASNFQGEHHVISNVFDEGFRLKLAYVNSGRMGCRVAVSKTIIQDLRNVLVYDLLPLADVDYDGFFQVN